MASQVFFEATHPSGPDQILGSDGIGFHKNVNIFANADAEIDRGSF